MLPRAPVPRSPLIRLRLRKSINFNLLVHRIHDGVNVVPAGGKPFIVVGCGGSHNDFSGVLFPGMSPSGSAPYLQDCSLCHVNGSEQVLPALA